MAREGSGWGTWCHQMCNGCRAHPVPIREMACCKVCAPCANILHWNTVAEGCHLSWHVRVEGTQHSFHYPVGFRPHHRALGLLSLLLHHVVLVVYLLPHPSSTSLAAVVPVTNVCHAQRKCISYQVTTCVMHSKCILYQVSYRDAGEKLKSFHRVIVHWHTCGHM